MIDVLLHFIVGFLMAYIGLLPPGMLNMTTARTTLLHGINKSLRFASGACIIVGIHGVIAFYFAEFLKTNPQIIANLRIAGMFVLAGLSYFFWKKAKSQFRISGKEDLKNPFIAGLVMSSLNMLGIPFYLGMSTILASKELIILEWPYNMFLTMGATLGSFTLFMTYGYFANVIDKKIGFISKNINLILSIVFLILSLSIAINMLTS